MSTYHQIKDGTAYPAVLLVHGMNDPRVDVWHSAKAAARLQAGQQQRQARLLRLDGQAGHGMGSTAQPGLQPAGRHLQLPAVAVRAGTLSGPRRSCAPRATNSRARWVAPE
jgi:hypothetical protein